MENLITKENTQSVEQIKIGANTLGLIKCRAMMSDVLNSVNNIYQDVFGGGSEEIEAFTDKYDELDKELCSLIAIMVENQMVESNYKEI